MVAAHAGAAVHASQLATATAARRTPRKPTRAPLPLHAHLSRVTLRPAAYQSLITHAQLIELGFGASAIKHRIGTGRLHPLSLGVYAVGRPQLTRHGQWMAAVLSCGPRVVLSHGSAAALWEIGSERRGCIEVSVLTGTQRRRQGVIVHRRAELTTDHLTVQHCIPLTAPIRTLVDIASRLDKRQLERAIREADMRGLWC